MRGQKEAGSEQEAWNTVPITVNESANLPLDYFRTEKNRRDIWKQTEQAVDSYRQRRKGKKFPRVFKPYIYLVVPQRHEFLLGEIDGEWYRGILRVNRIDIIYRRRTPQGMQSLISVIDSCNPGVPVIASPAFLSRMRIGK